MALTINNFWGAEFNDFSDTDVPIGAVSIISTTSEEKAIGLGSFKYELDGTSAPAAVSAVLPFYTGVADAGDGVIFGWRHYSADWSHLSKGAACRCNSGNSAFCTFSMRDDGDLAIIMWNSDIYLITPAEHGMVDDNTYYFEVFFERLSSNSNVQVFKDGELIKSFTHTGDDLTGQTIDKMEWRTGNTGSGVDTIDNMYLMTGATSASQRLGECAVVTERSNISTATPDTGDVLDSGTWGSANTIPFSASIEATYSADTVGGSVICNDIGTNGVSGGSAIFIQDIGGTPLAVKGAWSMSRSGGGSTAHYGLLGNSGDGTTRSEDFSATTGRARYYMFSEAATIVPNGTSEYLQIGMEIVGKQDFYCYGMVAQCLVQLPDTAQPSPPPLLSLPARAMRHMIIR